MHRMYVHRIFRLIAFHYSDIAIFENRSLQIFFLYGIKDAFPVQVVFLIHLEKKKEFEILKPVQPSLVN